MASRMTPLSTASTIPQYLVNGHCTVKTVRQWLLVFLLQNFKKKRQCDVDLDGCNLPMHFPRSPAL